MDTFNKFAVAAGGDGLVILNPPRQPMPYDDALLLAAYLVAMAEPFASVKFEDVLREVESA